MTLHDFGFLGNEPTSHGTRASYRAGCHCLPCRVANSSYEAARARAAVTGAAHTADASAARAHLLTLQRAGVGYRHAARLSGVSAFTVKAVRNGRQARITPETEQAILGVTKPTLAQSTLVNSYEARRKLRTLVAEGFSRTALARQLGLWRETVSRDTQVTPESEQGRAVPRMRVSSVRRIRALFARITAEGSDSASGVS